MLQVHEVWGGGSSEKVIVLEVFAALPKNERAASKHFFGVAVHVENC